MKLNEIFKKANPAISYEFFPPKTPKGEELLFQEANCLKNLNPAFFSMTYGAGGSTRDKTVDLGRRLLTETGVDTVCHLTCVGQSKDEVREVMAQLKAAGIENIMALRGDPPKGQEDWKPHPDGFHFAYEIVDEANLTGDFAVAVAGFPEVHPDAVDRESDLKFLKAKVDAGADVIVTQLFYDNEDFIKFDKDLKELGVQVPIVPGIMPVRSAAQVRRFTAMCKAKIPEKLDVQLSKVENDDAAAIELGVAYATEQIRELLDYGVPGVHIYCLNKAESAQKIHERLGLGKD